MSFRRLALKQLDPGGAAGNQVLTWNVANNRWQPAAAAAGSNPIVKFAGIFDNSVLAGPFFMADNSNAFQAVPQPTYANAQFSVAPQFYPLFSARGNWALTISIKTLTVLGGAPTVTFRLVRNGGAGFGGVDTGLTVGPFGAVQLPPLGAGTRASLATAFAVGETFDVRINFAGGVARVECAATLEPTT